MPPVSLNLPAEEAGRELVPALSGRAVLRGFSCHEAADCCICSGFRIFPVSKAFRRPMRAGLKDPS